MIVWSTLETSCPMCQHRLRVREVGGGFAIGQDTDLLVRMKGKHLIQAEIHTCQKCRFSGYARDFTVRRVSNSMVKRFFRTYAHLLRDDHSSRAIGDASPGNGSKLSQTPLPHLQYHWAALASPAIGLSPTETGLRMVRAYWCLRLSPSSSLPDGTLKKLRKLYLRDTISRLRQGLRFEKNRTLVYLVAELCRRNGNYLLASQYFERFISREDGPRYLKHAARKLLEAAKHGDSADRTMEQTLYGDSSEKAKRRHQRRDPKRADRGE